MRACPDQIGNTQVVCYTRIDTRHSHTGNTRQVINGVVLGPVSGLAICHAEGSESYFLFGCDEEWKSLSDTWHRSISEAKAQAEFEYYGTANTWIPHIKNSSHA